MERYEAVERRRTVRDLAATPVPPDALRRVLTAGLKAPTYNHLRQWDFVLLKDPTRRLRIAEAEGLPEQCDVDELQRAFVGADPLAAAMYLDAIPKQKRMLLAAPERWRNPAHTTAYR